MPLIDEAKTNEGCLLQIFGVALLISCGITTFITTISLMYDTYQLSTLFATFGNWTMLVGVCLLPLVYVAAIPLIWLATGVFPVGLSIIWLLSCVGALMLCFGSRVGGKEI